MKKKKRKKSRPFFGIKIIVARGDDVRGIDDIKTRLGPLRTPELTRDASRLRRHLLVRPPRRLVLQEVGTVWPWRRLSSQRLLLMMMMVMVMLLLLLQLQLLLLLLLLLLWQQWLLLSHDRGCKDKQFFQLTITASFSILRLRFIGMHITPLPQTLQRY
jgi:hypothetical protein